MFASNILACAVVAAIVPPVPAPPKTSPLFNPAAFEALKTSVNAHLYTPEAGFAIRVQNNNAFQAFNKLNNQAIQGKQLPLATLKTDILNAMPSSVTENDKGKIASKLVDGFKDAFATKGVSSLEDAYTETTKYFNTNP